MLLQVDAFLCLWTWWVRQDLFSSNVIQFPYCLTQFICFYKRSFLITISSCYFELERLGSSRKWEVDRGGEGGDLAAKVEEAYK